MKVFILKLWYVACTIFCLYNLNTLVSERYELANVAISRKKIDPILLLTCAKLSDLDLGKTEISLGGSSGDLYQHFKNSNKYSRWRDDDDDDFYDFYDYILAPLRRGNYRIFNGMLCFTVKDRWVAFKTVHFGLFSPVFFALKNSTADFIQIPSPFYTVDQLVVLKKGPPYSNCTENNPRNRCLNECFKAKFRLSRYFYEGSEVGRVYLSSATNQTIQENEKRCFWQCWRENCEMVQLIPTPDSGRRESRTTTLEAQPKLKEFDFWAQFIGLVCSFANISLNQLTSMVIQFGSLRVKRKKVRIGLFCIKWTILFLSLICCSYLYTTLTIDHLAKRENPNKKEIMRTHIKQKTIHLVICAGVEHYLSNISFYDFDLDSLNKTMLEIENATDVALDDVLKGIYVNYQERLFRMNFIPEPKVLFRQVFFRLNRCFSLLILPEYQLMPSNSKLAIKFKVDRNLNLVFYLLTENEKFNEKSFEYDGNVAFKKKTVKRLKFNEKRVDHANCVGRLHCVERCINRETLKKFKKIVIDKAVVDKEYYSSEEWNDVYTMEISRYGLNRSEYNKISEECEKKFPREKPLEEVKFEKTIAIIPPDKYTIEIDLFLGDEQSIEEFTWFNLLLNLMNIQSIFFGMTVLRLLQMFYSFYSFFKLKLQLLKRIRNDKTIQFFIYLLCSFGFTWHTYLILDLSINGELTYNLNYEIADRVQMPILVFCHRIDEKLIDRNHQLNGNYLDQITNEIIAESMFSSIIYLNKSNEWTPFNLSQVERFFFLNLKCFRIEIHQEYDRNQFHFSPNRLAPNVLKVIFTNKLLNQEKKKTGFFMTKTNETEFSNVLNLHYDYSPRSMKAQYSIDQSELTVNYEDHLSLIKRWISASYEDPSGDQRLFQLESNEHNIKTLKIPLEKNDFDIKLDDLFDQLFSTTQNARAYNLLGIHQQTSVFNNLKLEDSDSDMTFSLNLIKKTLLVKNEAKLILGLLNVLFWFDLGILDLHPIFVYFYDYLLILLPIYLLNKVTQLLLFSHRWLKKYEPPLYKRLNARKQNSPESPKSQKPSSILVLPD